MTTIAALVPMRHHSQRVPGKNFRNLAGKPLFQYIVEALIQVPEISRIVVDTDSEPIMDELKANFPQVLVLKRPDRLRADDIPMNEILAYDASQLDADFYLQTHSTNPLLKPETISRALQTFLNQYPAFDTLFSVTRLNSRLWDQLGRPINHNPNILLQTQNLPPIYEENSCIYLFTRKTLLERRNRIGERPLLYEIDPAEAWDIDEELDFAITEFLMKRNSDSLLTR